MHHVAVAIHFQQLLDVAGARLGDAGDVVAAQIHQHQVFGHLFLVLTQFQLDAAVEIPVDAAIGVEAAAAGTGDGVHLHVAAGGAEFHRALGGGAKQGEALILHVEHVGAGVGLFEAAIGGDGAGAGQGEAAGRHHLEDVATANEALELLHLGAELLVALVHAHAAGEGRGGRSLRKGLLAGVLELGEALAQTVVSVFHPALVAVAAKDAGKQRSGARDVVDGDQGLGHVEAVVGTVVAPLWHVGQIFKGGDEVVGEAAGHKQRLAVRASVKRAELAIEFPLQGAQHVQHADPLEAAVFILFPIGGREVELQLAGHHALGNGGGQALGQQALQLGTVVVQAAHPHGAATALDAQAGVHQQQALFARLGVDLHRFQQQVVGATLAELAVECQRIGHIGGVEGEGIEFTQRKAMAGCHSAFPCV